MTLRVAPALCLVTALFACTSKSSPPTAPTPPPAPTLAIAGLEGKRLQPGLKVQLTAKIVDPNGTSQECTATAVWTSSSAAFMKLTGVQPGEFQVAGIGDGSVGTTCGTVSGTLSIHIDQPTSWPVSGRVLSASDGAPVANATLSMLGIAPVQSDAQGRYLLDTPDNQVHPLLISAPGFINRDTFLRGGELRELDFGLLAPDPGFPLKLYREMVRNGKESPNTIGVAGLRRWTQNPNIYIWTTWKDTGAPVANVEWYVDEIRRVIPQLTGFRYQAGLIEVGPAQRPLTPGWIHVQFDHSGNWAEVAVSPGRLQFGGDHTCNSIAVVHEFGHAMGFWHSSLSPSIMGGGPAQCIQYNLVPQEQVVVNAAYNRALNNVEPDRDPAGSSLFVAGPDGPPVRVP